MGITTEYDKGDAELMKQAIEPRQKEDWEKRIVKALETGFVKDDKESSANWGCCAVGSRLQIEKPSVAKQFQECYNFTVKRILTPEAFDLGMKFNHAVRRNKVKEADDLFKKIYALPRLLKTDEELQRHDSVWFRRYFSHVTKFKNRLTRQNRATVSTS